MTLWLNSRTWGSISLSNCDVQLLENLVTYMYSDYFRGERFIKLPFYVFEISGLPWLYYKCHRSIAASTFVANSICHHSYVPVLIFGRLVMRLNQKIYWKWCYSCETKCEPFFAMNSILEVFLRKGVLKICRKFTGEHQCRCVNSVKSLSNFIEIALQHECSPVNLLHIFRTPFPKNTYGWLLLKAQ